MKTFTEAQVQELIHKFQRDAEASASKAQKARWGNRPGDAEYNNGFRTGLLSAVVDLQVLLKS